MNIKLLFRVIGNLVFIVGLGIAVFTYAPIFYLELIYASTEHVESMDESSINDLSMVNSVDDGTEYTNILPFVPSDPEFSIIIDKIAVNAPVVKDVTTVNEKAYMEALRYGVAHAEGTALPGEIGNMFFFAHSSLNFWQLGPYATVFNLLNKLEVGDFVIVYYEEKPYFYEIYENEVVGGWNTTPFDVNYYDSVVTLVTCDPPGSTKDRRVVKAKLME
ncbi:hypothetical protein CO178_02465 [candidate division WWE3 bacterium CG_4_9_14_3_um_filter_34_6]|uniref:Sortase n=1 Tax=candidate division WWE3 bacterium CG_4_9_14_3_um_filter_34_6 TaxID=1975079 RepID=A0A2M7X2C8_UNCKA|nr:MAG: hypothetical protein CO178_02465 [candidate division WWE3 bacterium CG_4_9_14_3_um_filter_34_6]